VSKPFRGLLLWHGPCQLDKRLVGTILSALGLSQAEQVKEVRVDMKHAMVRFVIAVGLASASLATLASAEETAKAALPTLLIKGEVVSNDTTDPSAALLKVKDRYGFETPIYLTPETKITQGDQTLASSSLSAGTPVEVEYNFDINTAKRQAVLVKVSGAATTASAPAAAPASDAAASTPASDASAAPAAPATEMAPATTEQPAAQ
jgi:hypothetical protein